MKKIASFCVDHTKLLPGIYLSRIDGDVVTYDIRMRRPNCGNYLQNPVMHTFEHLFATYARNSAFSDSIVYVGPMGCRTGFYFLVRDKMTHAQVIELLQESFAFIASYEGEIPGTEEAECGNCREHDLEGAKREAADMGQVILNWTPEKMQYNA